MRLRDTCTALQTVCTSAGLDFLKTRAAAELGYVLQDTHRSHHGAQGFFVIPTSRQGWLRSKWEAIKGQVTLGSITLKPAALHLCPAVCLSVYLGLFGERREKSGFSVNGNVSLLVGNREGDEKSHQQSVWE